MAATKIAANIGASAARNGRKAGLGTVCPIAHQAPVSFSTGRLIARSLSSPLPLRARVASSASETTGGGSSRDLPGGHRLAFRIFAVLQHNAHRRKFIANPIGFLEVLSRT